MNRYALDIVDVISPACSCRCGRSIKYEHNDSRPCILCRISLLLVVYTASLVQWLSGWQMCVRLSSHSFLPPSRHFLWHHCSIFAHVRSTDGGVMPVAALSEAITSCAFVTKYRLSGLCVVSRHTTTKKRTTSTGSGVQIVAYPLTECRRSLITSLPR